MDKDVHTSPIVHHRLRKLRHAFHRAEICLHKQIGASPCGSPERAEVATVPPAAVNRRTMASPAPLVPPVTRMRFPENSFELIENRLFGFLLSMA